jgi:predicted ATP-grasp superfamily ATP-dependent carboligase
LLGLTKKIISALNFTGIAHLDFRYDEHRREYVLIDFNSRYWSSVQGSRAMGVNFPVLVVSHALGHLDKYPDYQTGTYFFTSMAIRTIWQNITGRRKHKVRFKQTQLEYLYKDPFPEGMDLMRRLFNRSFKK